MSAVEEPFGGEEGVDASDVAGEVGEVGLGEVFEGGAGGEFLREVEDGPEEVGEAFVLDEAGVAEECDEPVAFVEEAFAEGGGAMACDWRGVGLSFARGARAGA